MKQAQPTPSCTPAVEEALIDDVIDAALRSIEDAEGWATSSLWIAPDASGKAAIWRFRGRDELLHCVGHVETLHFAALVAAAVVARAAGRRPAS
jgi:hypothetical protein